jgi:hypothetical protein
MAELVKKVKSTAYSAPLSPSLLPNPCWKVSASRKEYVECHMLPLVAEGCEDERFFLFR